MMTTRRTKQAYSTNHTVDLRKTLDSIEALRARAFQTLKEQRARLLGEVAHIDEQLEQLDAATRSFPTATKATGTGASGRSKSPSVQTGGNGVVASSRRSPAQMNAVKQKILNALVAMKAHKKARSNPTSLDLVQRIIPRPTTVQLARPLHQLIDAGTVGAHGAKSGTRYFLVSKR
jgi:hypothetical protein